MSLPSSYIHEISSLNRCIAREKPEDVLQFCANFFNKRLESQRQEFLLNPSVAKTALTSTAVFSASKRKMAESTFSGTASPFGAIASNPVMQQVKEDEEMDGVTSPTAATFGHASNDSPFAANRLTPGNSPFGTSFNPSQSPSFPPGSEDSNAIPPNYALGRRTSVSAESMNPTASASDNWTPPSSPKSADQVSRLKTAVAGNFLFSHLQDEQASQVLGALVEKPIPAKGIKVISQGDAGDYFYVVEKGTFDVYINPAGSVQPGPDGMGNKVSSIGPGGSFGELALMYNAPRAATIVSTEANSLLWALDRVTFRRILMDSAFQRRRMYESFLEEVPLLASLTAYERSKIADALETHKFGDGETIIQEGDIGESFFILEAGTANVTKKETGFEVVNTYSKGDYFGELALLDDKPRAASVSAVGDVKVASLGKEGFQRLLGPVEERMRQNDPRKGSIKTKASTDEVDPLTK